MFGEFSQIDLENVTTLLEDKVHEWSATWPYRERRTIEVNGNLWNIPEADKEHGLMERDVLNMIGGHSVVLGIPPQEQRSLPYVMYTLLRHESEALYGTQKIDCKKIVVGACYQGARIVLKKDFPFYQFIRGELEDAGVWQKSRERTGWESLVERLGHLSLEYRERHKNTYALDIFDDGDWDVSIIPKEVVHCYIPRSAFKWLSEQPEIGYEVSLDNFADEAMRFMSKGPGLHQLEVTKHDSTIQDSNSPIGRIEYDTELMIYGTSGFDRTYPGGAFFRDGRFVFGQLGRYSKIRDSESFKKAVVEYFELPTYELFEVFFCVNGLPESHRQAIKDIL